MMMSFKDAQNYKVLWSDFTMVSRFRKRLRVFYVLQFFLIH